MKLSIIIPVYKESSIINQQILHIKNQLSGKIDNEIIVSDGEHSTLEFIEDSSIIKVKSTKGRGNGLHDGEKASKGELLIFIHSDTKLPKDFDLLITKKCIEKDFAGAFDLAIDSNKIIFRIIEKMASIRSRLTKIPYGDQCIFCTKGAYKKVGGFEKIVLMEDVNFMQKIKKAKIKLYFIDTPVSTSSRRWDQEGVIYTTIRNWIIVNLYYLGVKPKKLEKWYTNFKNLHIFK